MPLDLAPRQNLTQHPTLVRAAHSQFKKIVTSNEQKTLTRPTRV